MIIVPSLQFRIQGLPHNLCVILFIYRLALLDRSESQTMPQLLGANTLVSHCSAVLFSCSLLAAGPQCLFLSTLPCFSPPSLSQIPPPPPPFPSPEFQKAALVWERERVRLCEKEMVKQQSKRKWSSWRGESEVVTQTKGNLQDRHWETKAGSEGTCGEQRDRKREMQS